MKDLNPDATYSYNPAKAKSLLQAAGVKPGTTITLYTYNSPGEMKEAQSVQNDLDTIGLNVKIDTQDWNTFLTNNEKGNVQGVFTLLGGSKISRMHPTF